MSTRPNGDAPVGQVITGLDHGLIGIAVAFAAFGGFALVGTIRGDATAIIGLVAAAIALVVLAFAPFRIVVDQRARTIVVRSVLRTRARDVADLSEIVRPVVSSQIRLHFRDGSNVVLTRGCGLWNDIEAALLRMNGSIIQRSTTFW